MATNKSQQEINLPTDADTRRQSSDLLPRFYRTDSNKKFLQSTLDQLTQPGTVKKVNGYIGRESAKAAKSTDVFVKAVDPVRQAYQLEPAAVIKDYLGNVTFFKDYIDHINHINSFGGITTNHERINRQEFYSWNPHICWDKFTNFQEYYWLPSGPEVIAVAGHSRDVVSTYSIKTVVETDNVAYLFTPNGLTKNPTVVLYRGQTYHFDISSKNNPLSIKTARTYGSDDRYVKGVSASAVETGTITFTVPHDAPATLFYAGETDPNAGGIFEIRDITENTVLNVEDELIGKKHYTTESGLSLSNGMKITFTGTVAPSKYSTGNWYVEGVGSAIVLVPEADLDDGSSYAGAQDYITINRASSDRNLWSRYNKWFHKDVISTAAAFNNLTPSFDQTSRAKRPIIEFDAGLKLFNLGYKFKNSVNVIDTFTTDVFSSINGAYGYNVDGVALEKGMRVLFAADTDSMVCNKIYEVDFVTINFPGRKINFKPTVHLNSDTGVFTFAPSTDINNFNTTFNGHGLVTGDQVVYLNNNFKNLSGVSNRDIYSIEVIDTQSFRLISNGQPVVVRAVSTENETHIFEVFAGTKRIIDLIEVSDSAPTEFETVLVTAGSKHAGQMFWFDGDTWVLAQNKTAVNQAPLFDAFDANKVSFGSSEYSNSSFAGTKIFSYKVGSVTTDAVLGFPLSYQNIDNVGDINFEFNLLTDSFFYKNGNTVSSQKIDAGFLQVHDYYGNISYTNGWTTSELTNVQPVVRVYKESGLVNDFPVDVFENSKSLTDLYVNVFVNGKQLRKPLYSLVDSVVYKNVRLATDVALTDVVTVECYSAAPKNDLGHYKFPINLQNNPRNESLERITFGQVADHVNSMVGNLSDFVGDFPGTGNLRDIPSASAYGTKIVQHSSPLNFSIYHLGSRQSNVFKALEQSRNDYGKFKRLFINAANSSGFEGSARQHVDLILSQLNKDLPNTQPYYLSDMFAFAGAVSNEITVVDARIKSYPLAINFNLDSLSNKSVLIYLNGEHLLAGVDYSYSSTGEFFELLCDINEGDILEVVEYQSTDGSFCPPTPTKLGLYPKFVPAKYLDDTYAEPTYVIQGHDGSITIAFNDYRDDLILELEKRIYNNIKASYDTTIFDILDFIPGYSRDTGITREEFDSVLAPLFYDWTTYISKDFTQYIEFDRLNPFTFNYRDNYAPDGSQIPAYWRGVYKWVLDTDRPHTHPWECIGFSVKPLWWEEVYGPAPYTSNNTILWSDIRGGIIREPGAPAFANKKVAKSILEYGCPVDDNGSLVNPIDCNFAQGYLRSTAAGYWTVGDTAPVEAAWRRSSYYPFAIIQALLVLAPARVIGTTIDRSRVVRNLCNQLVYKDTGLRVRLQDLVLPATVSSSSRVYTSGLVNYVVDYILGTAGSSVSNYQLDLSNLDNNVSSKLGGFTSKQKLSLLLDSKNPAATSGVFVPQEDYQIFLNTSSPICSLTYSGVVITKQADGFEVRGYNPEKPYFNYFAWDKSGQTIKVGGISESYLEWSPNERYVAGKVVFYAGKFYRVKTSHTAAEFDKSFFAQLPELPMIGGQEATLRTGWNKQEVLTVAYSTKISTIQGVVDFLLGYGEFLTEQGFVFDDFNKSLNTVSNWESSVREFLFWTTQNWPAGSVISLSPAAGQLTLNTGIAVAQDIFDSFFGYKVYQVDGSQLRSDLTNVFREDGYFALVSDKDGHGIYGATIHLVQKEHVMLLNNTTMFNDLIYDRATGYKQDRLKVVGYMSKDWSGGFNIPGFIFDDALITEWQQWKDYSLGDTVKYKEFYYSANSFISGVSEFDESKWTLLASKPESALLPNWDYKANQFFDFYDLDSDNFDTEQQRLAQHLVGYQKRSYLTDIIKDDVSQYKFYQGMIAEKGTKNVLSKLFDVVSSADKESVEFSEEWAVRVGTFGAIDAFKEIEVPLDEAKFKLNPQPVEVSDNISFSATDLVYRLPFGAVYNQAKNVPLFPVKKIETPFLRTPGFAFYDEVKMHVDNLDDIVSSFPVSSLQHSDLVWCGFEGRSWNVYAYQNIFTSVTSASYLTSKVTLNLTNFKTERRIVDRERLVTIPDNVKSFTVEIMTDRTLKTWFDDNLCIFEDNKTTFDCGVYGMVNFDDKLCIFDDGETTFDASSFANLVEVYDTETDTKITFTISKIDDVTFNVEFNKMLKIPKVMRLVLKNTVLNTEDIYSLARVSYDRFKIVTDDYVGVTEIDLLNGFYKVTDFTASSFTFAKTVPSWPAVVDTTEVIVYRFNSRKGVYVKAQQEKTVLRPDASIIKSAFLYNRNSGRMVTHLDVVDVTTGKIPSIANKELTFKTYYDPAVYSTATSADVTVDAESNWTDEQVGMLWWDLTRARFIENQKGTTAECAIRWNKLFERSLPNGSTEFSGSVDILEWVSSKVKPSEWDKLADTEKGLAMGISGTSVYGDSVYSTKERYDTVSKSLIKTYYFWVKNRTIVPQIIGRSISASEISSLIADPAGYGYPCIALTGENSFALVNVARMLQSNEISLNLRYKIAEGKDTNVHQQWKIISESTDTILPKKIETKWFDSLVGVDTNGQPVPNMSIPAKARYGVENTPSQSMFVNRIEALKQCVERINSVIAGQLIAENYDLSALSAVEPYPSIVSGEWDLELDTDAELKFVKTSTLSRAVLSPVIENGKIIRVDIVKAGSGYKTAPTISITGQGSGAEFKTTIEAGKIVAVEVTNSGKDYEDTALIVVRPFTVLIKSDSTVYDKWSIRSWEASSMSWNTVKVQTYDVSRFWNYVDWYATGYNHFVKVDKVVSNTYELITTDLSVGEIVKVTNFGTSGWALVKKYNDAVTVDYTKNFEVIARENGSIQFSKELYLADRTADGYDELFYDLFLYDNYPVEEIRIILQFIKDTLFVDSLYGEYLKLFFASIRYVLSEQFYTDWVFKTSFVKVKHNVGDLKQPVTFNADPLENFEEYINEVKPYKTKIREFVSSYSNVEKTQSIITDFDLPPAVTSSNTVVPVDVVLNSDGTISSTTDFLNQYPWKFWNDNFGFSVVCVEIVNGGSGYFAAPDVYITDKIGSGAKATATVVDGVVTEVTVTSPGRGFLRAPAVEFAGGLVASGTPATAIAVIESELVRSNKIAIKFDRVSKVPFVKSIVVTDSGEQDLPVARELVGNGTRKRFPLRWNPRTTHGSSTVKLGVDIISSSEYTLLKKNTVVDGHTFRAGEILFNTAPAAGVVISVEYEKDFDHLSATDRINLNNSQYGVDFAQLMTGIDYAGTVVSGRGFTSTLGWGSSSWANESWDQFSDSYDYAFLVEDMKYRTFTLPFAPNAGDKVNVYISDVNKSFNEITRDQITRIDYDPAAETASDTLMETFVGDGFTSTIVIPANVPLVSGKFVIFRKEITENNFDTSLSAGDFSITAGAYATAAGTAPDEIMLDGDGFVTVANSAGPEEVVPGHLVDAVAIKVYTRPSSVLPNIMEKKYVANGTNNLFAIGQQIPTNRSVIVRLDSNVLGQDQYSVNWKDNAVELVDTPAADSLVYVVSFGFNSTTMLDYDYFEADGSTREFVTKAPWLTNLSATVLVNGIAPEYELFRTDETYKFDGLVGIRFAKPIPAGDMLVYMIDIADGNSSIRQTSSITKSQTIIFDPSVNSYTLDNIPVDAADLNGPLAHNIIVKRSRYGEKDAILAPGSSAYFTMKQNKKNYVIDKSKIDLFDIPTTDIKVYSSGNLLTSDKYSLDLPNNKLVITADAYVKDGVLAIVAESTNDYAVVGNSITFFGSLLQTSDVIEVISFYDHMNLVTERTTTEVQDVSSLLAAGTITPASVDYFDYTAISTGKFRLSKPVISPECLWVIKNREILTANVDYILDSSKGSITLTSEVVPTDKIQMIVFNKVTEHKSFAYMQFKDMLNRVHYKRLSAEKTTQLAQDLLVTDTEIVVKDGSKLSPPHSQLKIPGVVEINGERIEYFTKEGNVLKNIRRATLGTSMPDRHRYDLLVSDIGPMESLPYTDTEVTTSTVLPYGRCTVDMTVLTVTSEHSGNLVPGNTIDIIVNPMESPVTVRVLSFRDINQNGQQTYNIDIPLTVINEVEFAGVAAASVPLTAFMEAEDLTNGITAEEIKAKYADAVNVFVGGFRLQKHDYLKYDEASGYSDSPLGDILVPADFVATIDDNGNKVIKLTAPTNQEIKVVKREGRVWEDTDKTLGRSNSMVAKFLREKEAVWPQYIVDKYQYILDSNQNTTIFIDSGDEPLELD